MSVLMISCLKCISRSCSHFASSLVQYFKILGISQCDMNITFFQGRHGFSAFALGTFFLHGFTSNVLFQVALYQLAQQEC